MLRSALVAVALGLAAVTASDIPFPDVVVPAMDLESSALTDGEVVSFLPEWMSHFPLESFWPADSSEALNNDEDATKLVQQFSQVYPDIRFSILWNRREVNAQARFVGGVRYVELFAGLVRHRSITWAGIAVVLAHEAGHHHGGPPRYPASWASCEGQSDYWGTLTSMRSVFGGSHHSATTVAAEELYKIFSGGFLGLQPAPVDKALLQCRHPPAACRRETYLAGRDQRPKPACAV